MADLTRIDFGRAASGSWFWHCTGCGWTGVALATPQQVRLGALNHYAFDCEAAA